MLRRTSKPEAEAELDAEPLDDAAAATLVVETVEVVPDEDTGALLVVAEAEAIVEAIPEAEAEIEPAPEIIPLPTTVVAASVDVGANSAHLLVAAVTGHLVEPLLDESAFLGLGDRVATHGYFGADARDELVSTLAGYADAARSLGASSVTFVGTEPVRRAADAAPLIHAVEGRANAPLHVLDHDEEAKLTLLGVTGGRPVDSELLVIDIGGGSSEFVIVGPDRPVTATGIRLGSAILTKEHSKADPPTLKEIEAMRKAAKVAIADAPDANPAEIIAVGGTASNLLKLLPATAVDRMLTRRRITVALAMLTVQRSAEAAERHMLRPQRARVLPAGALIVDAILERYDADACGCATRASARAWSSPRRPRASSGAIACPRWSWAGRTGPAGLTRGGPVAGARRERLEPGDEPSDRAPEPEAGDAAPRRPDGPPEPGELALAIHEVAPDRGALLLGQVARVLDEEAAGEPGGDVGVVEPAQVVLERDDALDDRRGLGAERLAHELERVAQPLGGDPQVVERRDVGPAHHGLVRPDALVCGPDPRRHRVPHAVGLDRPDRAHPDALRLDERDVLVDPALVPLRVELLDQHHPRGVTLRTPLGKQRLECRPVRRIRASSGSPRPPR